MGDKTNHFCCFVLLDGGHFACQGILGFGRVLFSRCYFEMSRPLCTLMLDVGRSSPPPSVCDRTRHVPGAGSNSGRASEAAAWDRFAGANREAVQRLSITVRKGGSSASNVFPLLSSHPCSYELLIIFFTAQLTIPSYIFCP